MKIFLKTEDELKLMRCANRLVASTLAELAKHIKPGVTTWQLDKIAEEYIRDHGATPSFKNYPNPYGAPFPASICTSVNDVVVHGIPSKSQSLSEGDIISIDCGVKLNGYNGDSCYTFSVGEIPEEASQLLKATKQALYAGIAQAVEGKNIGHIAHAIQTTCEHQGYGIVRELTGHGIGRSMHEDPLVPNYGNPRQGPKLKAGMCIAIEPMVTQGSRQIYLACDRWTILTRDHSLAAHFEHTIAVSTGQAEVLSSFEEIEQIERQKQ